jgi:LmbE family N-acetylglucosaminyl deacetylase
VAPHPDDETIAAWGLMRCLHRQGAHIAIVVVSDGAASHPDSARWPQERLTAERRRETLRAMRQLGVMPPRITFLGLPDGDLASDCGALRRGLSRVIRRLIRLDVVVGPEASDAHADHRAVARALATMRHRGERRISYHVWPTDAARGARPLRVNLKGPALAIKRQAIRSYRTQCGRITDAPTGFNMTGRQLNAFARPQERFAVQR